MILGLFNNVSSAVEIKLHRLMLGNYDMEGLGLVEGTNNALVVCLGRLTEAMKYITQGSRCRD